MIMLFDQDYATEAYAEEKARRRERIGEIKGAVSAFQDVGMSIEEIIHRLAAKFDITAKKASQYVRKFWKK